MSLLFDSSSIFRAIRENRVELLAGNYTLELARYELGNILWKEHTLHRRIDEKELMEIMRIIKESLRIMKKINIDSHEIEVLKLSKELKSTFYDASYITLAKNKNITIITEDKTMRQKAEETEVKALHLNILTET